jgi:hypothetical protein
VTTETQPPTVGGKRERKQAQLIAALLTEPTIEAAARKAGVSKRTALRWMKSPPFAAAYRQARRAVVEHAVTGMQRLSGRSVEVLARALEGDQADPRLALGVYDRSVAGLETFDLVDEVARLAAKLEELQRGGHGAGPSGGADGAGPEPAGPAGAGGPDPDPAAGRPGEPVPDGRPDARPVANGAAVVPSSPAVAPLFPAER